MALRESRIPFFVEAQDWARIPEEFHREIERDYVVLRQPGSVVLQILVKFYQAKLMLKETTKDTMQFI